MILHRNQRQAQATPAATPVAPVIEEQTLGATIDWVPEPNEPRYCLCNQVCFNNPIMLFTIEPMSSKRSSVVSAHIYFFEIKHHIHSNEDVNFVLFSSIFLTDLFFSAAAFYLYRN